MRGALLVFLIGILVGACLLWQRGDMSQDNLPNTQNSMLTLTSSAFENGGVIPSKYTCDGENMSPPLAIGGVPEGAQSLVLITEDPDAPAGLWVHWVVFNINPALGGVEENEKFIGAVEGMTGFGKQGYGGPCPPDREHRYFFKLYALDTMVDLDSSATKEDVERAMEGHVLEQTELMGRYERGK